MLLQSEFSSGKFQLARKEFPVNYSLLILLVLSDVGNLACAHGTVFTLGPSDLAYTSIWSGLSSFYEKTSWNVRELSAC